MKTPSQTPKQPAKRKPSKSNRRAALATSHPMPVVCASIRDLPVELRKGFSLANMGGNLARAESFLLALYDCGKHSLAMGQAGVTWGTIMRFRSAFPDFNGLYLAIRASIDERRAVEAREALHERAVVGLDKPVYQQGKKVGTIREYSDKLLETELRALDPSTFRPDETGGGSGLRVTINLDIGDLQATKPPPAPINVTQAIDMQPLEQRGDTGTKPVPMLPSAPDAQPALVPDAPATTADTITGSASAT